MTTLLSQTMPLSYAAPRRVHTGFHSFHLKYGDAQPLAYPVNVPSKSQEISLNGGVHRILRVVLMKVKPCQRDVKPPCL